MTIALDRGISNFRFLRNRIVNGGMQISQENASNAGTTSGFYPSDELSIINTSTATFSTQSIGITTPGGSGYRTRLTITAGATPATGAALLMRRKIEGFRLVDLLFGAANAKYIVKQFGFRSTIAGTFGVSFFNSAVDRVYAGQITVLPGEINTDLVRTVILKADVTGTWLTTNGIGCYIDIAISCHANLQRAPYAWGAVSGTYYSNQMTNNLVTGAVFEVFDVGLYEGTSPPPFEQMPYSFDLAESQRYYWRNISGSDDYAGALRSGGDASVVVFYPQVMRAGPSVTATFALGSSPSLVRNSIRYAWVYGGTATDYLTGFIANARL